MDTRGVGEGGAGRGELRGQFGDFGHGAQVVGCGYLEGGEEGEGGGVMGGGAAGAVDVAASGDFCGVGGEGVCAD